MAAKRIIKDALILFLITLIAGAALGYTRGLTEPIIEEARAQKTKEAYGVVFPNAASFEECNFAENYEISKSNIAKYDFGDTELNNALRAKDADGNTLGYAVTATSHEGYGGDIQVIVGVDTVNMKTTGISFLTLNETAGLGMKAKESKFKDQFVGKTAGKSLEGLDEAEQLRFQEPVMLEVVKTGNANDQQVDAITGATKTSRAVTNAVNLSVYFATHCVAE